MLKRLFILCLTIMAFVFVGCEKNVDPSKVEFEVSIEKNGATLQQYRFVCYGSLGGFIGDAEIVIEDDKGYSVSKGNKVSVTGAKTPYSFTFYDGNAYNASVGLSSGLPPYYNVKVLVKNKTVMETSVVPRK